MERRKLKEILKELGVREELTEMPAVVEPLYKEFMEKSASVVKNSGDILVLANGDFKVGKKSIEFDEITGGAKISHKGATIDVNEYGIEEEYSDGDQIGLFSYTVRKDGVIESTSGNNGNATIFTSKYYDNGSWSIEGACGPQIGRRDENENPVPVDEKQLLEDFDNMAETMSTEYPKTKEWYNQKREELQSALSEFNSPEERGKAEMDDLRRTNSELIAKNKELTSNNEKLTAMLGKTLKLMGKLIENPVVKILFRKAIKEYEESSETLGPGRDDE